MYKGVKEKFHSFQYSYIENHILYVEWSLDSIPIIQSHLEKQTNNKQEDFFSRVGLSPLAL